MLFKLSFITLVSKELGHCEIICTMVKEFTKNATLKELESVGLGSYYADFNKCIYPVNVSGVPFTASYFAVTADPLADLSEDMAAEQKARTVYKIIKIKNIRNNILF